MVDKLDSYPWSSYPAYVGKRKPLEWLEIDWLLSLFDKRPKEASKKYRSYVEGVDAGEIKNPDEDVVGGLILGGASFVNWVKDTFLSDKTGHKEIPQLNELKPRVALQRLVQKVCDEFGCDIDQILRKGLKKNLARDVTIYLAREITDTSGVNLGNFFGGISGAGITIRYNHIAKQLERNRRLKGRINQIKKRIINN